MNDPPKNPVLAILSSAGAAAVMGAMLWWVIHGAFLANRAGGLAAKGGLLGTFWPGAAAGAVIGAIGGAVQLAGRQKQMDDLADQAALAGLSYESDAMILFDRHDGLRRMPLLEDMHSAEHLMIGTRNGRNVTAFELTKISRSRSGESSPTITRRTVLLMPDAGLAALDVQPRGLLISLAQAMIGFQGMTFDANSAANPADAEVIRRFERLYFVCPMHETARFGTAAMIAAANDPGRQEPVRRVLRMPVMRRLVESPGWQVQSHGGHLVLAKQHRGWLGTLINGGGRRPLDSSSGSSKPDDRVALIDEALAIQKALESGGPVVAAGTGAEAGRQRSHHLRRAALGVAGAIFGFATGFGGFASLMLHLGGQLGTQFLIALVALPLCVFGGLALGLGLGLRLDSWLPAPTPAPRVKRPRSAAIGAVVGTFLGFFLGGFGGIGVLSLLDPHRGKPGDAWYFPLLVFSTMGLGAATGLLAGAALGTRLGRPRNRRSSPARNGT